MIAFAARSPLPVPELLRRSEPLDALVLDPSCAQSAEELELARHLAERSFGKKGGIASKFRYEFLLWLTGKTDIRSAMTKSRPKDNEKILIVSFEKNCPRVLKSLEAEETGTVLAPRASPLRLEEISLSRIRN